MRQAAAPRGWAKPEPWVPAARREPAKGAFKPSAVPLQPEGSGQEKHMRV